MTEEQYRLIDADRKKDGPVIKVTYLTLDIEAYSEEPLICAVTGQTSEGFWTVRKLRQFYDHDLELYSWEPHEMMFVNPAHIVIGDWCEARWASRKEFEDFFKEEEE